MFCFNPRPPISQRATHRDREQCRRALVSIHARQFHSGRLRLIVSSTLPEAVSIHARQFHSGRRPSGRRRTRRAERFNPRPPISQRATAWRCAMAPSTQRFNPRPPISQRATRRTCAVLPASTCFNPRPPISQRATCRRACSRSRLARFNPRPPISQRATARPP